VVERLKSIMKGVERRPVAMSEALLFWRYVKLVDARLRVLGLPAACAARYECAVVRRPSRVHSADDVVAVKIVTATGSRSWNGICILAGSEAKFLFEKCALGVPWSEDDNMLVLYVIEYIRSTANATAGCPETMVALCRIIAP
jgi:hypothetical protein